MEQQEGKPLEVAKDQGPEVKVVIDHKHYSFHKHEVTGAHIKEKAGVPSANSLYRRGEGSNEPISDSETVKLHDGDHFFSRAPANVS